ncbi:MAG: hypothetical protein ACI8YQ_001946 [Polaribacter sp.]|jgi:hypothetical protein
MKYLIFILVLSLNVVLFAQPSDCDGDYFLSTSFEGSNAFNKIQIAPSNNEITFNPLNPAGSGLFVNSVGFRPTDNFMYVLAAGNNLARINAAGQASIIATIPNFDPELNYYGGDVSPDGQFLFVLGTGTQFSTLVTSSGWYFLEVISNCQILTDSIYVYSSGFEINLPANFTIELADSILLPLIHYNNPTFEWDDLFGNSLSCLTGVRPFARPFFDGVMVRYQGDVLLVR